MTDLLIIDSPAPAKDPFEALLLWWQKVLADAADDQAERAVDDVPDHAGD